MRLNSISQAVASGDAKLGAALIKHSAFSSQLLDFVGGRPALRDPQAFEEAFADAKWAHINKEKQHFSDDCLANQIASLRKNPNSKTTRERQLPGQANLPRSRCLLLRPLQVWPLRQGLFSSPKLLTRIWSIVLIPMIF